MNRWKWLLASLPLMAGLASAPPAHAKVPTVVTNLLQEQPAMCDGRGTYGYKATWDPVIVNGKPWTNYVVATGNVCQLSGGQVCSLQRGCQISCGDKGRCSVQLNHCQIGHGASWVGVTPYGAGSQLRHVAPPPSRCL